MTNVVKINAKDCRKVINCNKYSNIDPEDFEGLVLYDMNKNRDADLIGNTFGLRPITYIEKPHLKTIVVMRVDVMNEEMEREIKKSPTEYAWEYKKFRKLSQEPKSIYKS